MHDTIAIKTPDTQYGVSEFIIRRFSPRAFSERALESATLLRFFEAASWAPSANNEQPWSYRFALKDTAGFERIWNCLMPGNQPWAKNAAALVIATARKSFAATGKPNGAAEHDLGMANANFLLEAAQAGVYGHPMGGFVREKLVADFELSDNEYPVCVFALGYLGTAEQLEEPFLTREKTPRSRRAVSEFVSIAE